MNNLTIIMYHYVRNLSKSKYSEIKGLDLDLFIEQINYLKKNYYIITMEEVIECIEKERKIPQKSVLLTFDDAYLDHYLNVFPILNEFQVQGSFYAPVKAITNHVVLDVNKIHFVLASHSNKQDIIEDLRLLLVKYKDSYNLHDFDYYYNKLAKENGKDSSEVIFIKRLLQVGLDEELRLMIVDFLFKKYVGVEEEIFSRELYMNEIQLKHMLRSGMHIGNHGFNHYWWNNLSEAEVQKEIDLSTDFLLGLGVEKNKLTACYPYGSFDDKSVELLMDRGYKLALTTQVAIAELNKENRFLLPRLDTNDIPKDRHASLNIWYDRA